MEIKTITCHHVYNYGASLQAYALQSYLESLGHNVEIIDYRLATHNRYDLLHMYPHGVAYKLINSMPFLKYLIAPYKNRQMLKTWGRKNAFDSFDKQYLHIGKVTYRNPEEIKANPPSADMYIAGSDQIWNPQMPNGTDLGYYLDFGDRKTKRISYAASFGVKEISQAQGIFVKSQLERFDAISVREQSGLDILGSLGIKAEICVDPVFLLDGRLWIERLKLKVNNGGYIMLYDFTQDDERIRNFALALAKATGLKIKSINDFKISHYADVQVNNAGPIEFLQYLINADFIVANSFHATAFSLIFHKKFATFPLINQPNLSRMTDLLKSVGLSEHFSPNNLDLVIRPINWSNIDEKLAEDIALSKRYVDNCLR